MLLSRLVQMANKKEQKAYALLLFAICSYLRAPGNYRADGSQPGKKVFDTILATCPRVAPLLGRK